LATRFDGYIIRDKTTNVWMFHCELERKILNNILSIHFIMPVKLVTDSTADIPTQIISELGITVIPAILHFGDETYRDCIDLTTEQFYEKLVKSYCIRHKKLKRLLKTYW